MRNLVIVSDKHESLPIGRALNRVFKKHRKCCIYNDNFNRELHLFSKSEPSACAGKACLSVKNPETPKT
jgi:hypothetical protein